MRWRINGATSFALGLGVIAVIWLVVLPRIGQQPAVRARIDRHESKGIDPSAMFYTELDAMPELLDKVVNR